MESGQRRDLAVPPPLHAAEPHGEIFDPALVWRESDKTKPSFVLPSARATEHDERGRKRYGSTEARFRVTRLRYGRITTHNFGMLRSMCGKDAGVKDYTN
jgi:hypothetical protein